MYDCKLPIKYFSLSLQILLVKTSLPYNISAYVFLLKHFRHLAKKFVTLMKSFKNQNNDFKFPVNLRGKLIKQEQF